MLRPRGWVCGADCVSAGLRPNGRAGRQENSKNIFKLLLKGSPLLAAHTFFKFQKLTVFRRQIARIFGRRSRHDRCAAASLPSALPRVPPAPRPSIAILFKFLPLSSCLERSPRSASRSPRSRTLTSPRASRRSDARRASASERSRYRAPRRLPPAARLCRLSVLVPCVCTRPRWAACGICTASDTRSRMQSADLLNRRVCFYFCTFVRAIV